MHTWAIFYSLYNLLITETSIKNIKITTVPPFFNLSILNICWLSRLERWEITALKLPAASQCPISLVFCHIILVLLGLSLYFLRYLNFYFLTSKRYPASIDSAPENRYAQIGVSADPQPKMIFACFTASCTLDKKWVKEKSYWIFTKQLNSLFQVGFQVCHRRMVQICPSFLTLEPNSLHPQCF